MNELICSLLPKDQEEMHLLQTLINSVHSLGNRQADLALAPIALKIETPALDERSLWDIVPEESRRYLHGLIEALEIYRSIHAEARLAPSISLNPASVNEIRQIRDMCIEEVPWSTY